MALRIAVFGLGEAGNAIAGDLAAAGAQVHGYDPAPVATPPGVTRHEDPADAVAGAELVLAITAAADAQAAIAQAWDRVKRGTLYADLSTAPASLKQDLDDTATLRGLPFADVALMATVPGNGVATPSLASGSGAERYAEIVNGLGGRVEVVSESAGDAATRKLLRSVFVKGLTAVVIEALRAADAAGQGGWLRSHLAEVIESADAALLRRLVTGTARHHGRRTDEMEHAATLLRQLGLEAPMTDATIDALLSVATLGIPDVTGLEPPAEDQPKS